MTHSWCSSSRTRDRRWSPRPRSSARTRSPPGACAAARRRRIRSRRPGRSSPGWTGRRSAGWPLSYRRFVGSVGFGAVSEGSIGQPSREGLEVARAREVERSAPGSESAGTEAGPLKSRDVISGVGGDDGAMEGGPRGRAAELRTRTPFVVRYLYAPVLGRGPPGTAAARRGKGIGGQAGQPT